ncbi:MAG: hypothetical protein WCZ23_16125 [Rhodospirillaceae bacterium]
MTHLLRIVAATWVALALAACQTAGPKPPTTDALAGFESGQLGALYGGAYYISNSWIFDGPTELYIDAWFHNGALEKGEAVKIYKSTGLPLLVQPGVYRVTMFANLGGPGGILPVPHTLQVIDAEGVESEVRAPVEVEVFAGQTTYFGHIRLPTPRDPKASGTLVVEDRFESARAHLAKNYPALAAAMRKDLLPLSDEEAAARANAAADRPVSVIKMTSPVRW